jgi:hypothetical protein
MSCPITLYLKEGFNFIKNSQNNYSLKFYMENNNIILPNIIDFNLVKLIYDLNNDVYEKVHLEKINENESEMVMLMKHLFEDIGMPQRFSYVNIKKHIEPNKITFTGQSIRNKRPSNMPPDSEQLPIQNINCTCNVITNHKIEFICNIVFYEKMMVPPFAEKMVGLIIFKIFNRVKQFIENVVI